MKQPPPTPIELMTREDFPDEFEFEAFADLERRARRFLTGQAWCAAVKRGYFDRGFSKVAVFLYEIDPVRGADPEVWIIVGDLPPAYLDKLSCPDGADALDAYVYCMNEWVEAVLAGHPTDELIPVLTAGGATRVPETREFALELRERLEYIDRELLPLWQNS
jgi:hypothetical protein